MKHPRFTNVPQLPSVFTTVQGNSANWQSGYTTVQSNSANWQSVFTTVRSNSANWQSVYATVCALSASWEESADILPTVTNYLSTSNVLISGLTLTGNIFGTGPNVAFHGGVSTGNKSFAEGDGSIASGSNSHAEGLETIASGIGSHAEGYATTASGLNSHSEGQETIASGSNSHAEGFITKASGNGSHAEGVEVLASGNGSHAEGDNTVASGNGSHAEGFLTATGKRVYYNSFTNSTKVFTFTPETSAEFDYVTPGTVLKGKEIDLEGNSFIFTVQNRSTITGNITAIESIIGADSSYGFIFNNSGEYAHVEGFESVASGLYSHAEGDYTEASGYASHAEGEASIASGRASHAEGGGTASGDFSHAESGGTASGDNSHAEGDGTASGNNSHAEGLITTASGIGSHAEGNTTIASGNSSHAEGDSTEASGQYSHAEGFGTKSLGDSTHAEGSYTQALQYTDHAEGSYTIASGTASHAEGRYTVAFGDTSHAAGTRTTAAQHFTYAWSDGNLGTLTKNISTTRSGQYMVSASGGVFIPGKVGIGTDSIANALTVVGSVSASGFYGDGSNLTNINFNLTSSNVTLSTVTLNPIATLSSTTFITSRVLQDKLGEIISVKDFGARGNGATNDWLAIQRALSAAAGIAKVYIPSGLYFISQELKIPSNSYIYGAGIGSTVIKLSSTANATQCVMTNSQNTRSVATNLGNENIVIKDLELDGNVSRFPGSYSPVGDTSGTGLCFAYVKNALVERVAVHDTCRHCFDICAPETSVTFNPLDYTPNPSFNVHLKDIIAYGAGDDNITTHFSHSIIIENPYVPYTGGTEVPANSNGIEIDDGSYDITIIGGYIKNCRRGLEVKGHSWAPAAKRVKVYGLTCENNTRNFGIRHLGFDSTDSKTAFDVALYDCTSIAPVSSTATTDTPRSLQISNYDGVFVKDFKVVGEHNASRAITIQERARNVNFDGVTFTQISGAITGITDAMLYIDSTASRNITVRNAIFRDCIGLPIAAIGSIPGVIIDGVDASTSLSANPPARVIDFSWSPLDTPYIIRNVTMTGYSSAYQLGGSHDFDYPTTIDIGRITNIIPASPATANTQYTAARFGWREGTGQSLNAGLGTRIEFTGNLVSGVSANTDLPVAYIGTRKVNGTDSDVTSNLTFGTLSANNSTAVDRLTITPTGNVGINTTTPNERLTVVGNISATGIIYTNNDVEITDFTKGIILRSPNGNRWRTTILNDGGLSSVQL